MAEVGRIATGTVAEQRVRWGVARSGLVLRCLRVRLDKPTRVGDTTLSLLTTVPSEAADACTLADL